ncbi:MAG: hypothetical protein Fur003_5670 [Candidatus Dojkabacteria bacterium]
MEPVKKKSLLIPGVITAIVAVAVVGGLFTYNAARPAIAFANATNQMSNFKQAEFEMLMSTDMVIEFNKIYNQPTQSTTISMTGEGQVDVDAKKCTWRLRQSHKVKK